MSIYTSELYNGNFESPDPRFSEVFKNGFKGNISETFQIHPPKLYTDGLAIRGLGTSTFIKVDTDPWSIGNLLHEFTHYLQHHGRTSPFKYIKQNGML